MKIGIITYYGDLNSGTNLQAYATLQAIKSVYPNDKVEIIPFHGFRPRILPYKSFSPLSIMRDFQRIYKYNIFKKEKLQIAEKDVVQRDVTKALKYISDRKYDVIYVGADTLLELDRLPVSHDGLSAYWLINVEAKKILIAASVKNVEFEKLLVNQKKEMKIAVKQFAYLGIRDSATQKLLSHFADEDKIEYVPDPTFVLKIDYAYIEKYLKKKRINISKKSVFIHTYSDDYWAYELTKIFKKEKYQIVSPRPAKWTDVSLNDMSPLEQIGIYRYFEFVITHRFHDIVFCLKNNTPVMLYEKGKGFSTSAGESKYTSLLKDFELYPDNFIGSDYEVTTTSIIEKKQNAIENFKIKEKIIIERVHEKANDYLSFLAKTVGNK